MTQNIVIGTIAGIVTIVGTVLAVSMNYISKAQFTEFKEGTIVSVEKRMDRMDSKLDTIIEEQRRLSRHESNLNGEIRKWVTVAFFSKQTNEEQALYCYCPVCNCFLGKKVKSDTKSFKDSECGYTWWFYPNQKLPKGIKLEESKINTNCGCGRCGH